jgi:hypothetical protein
VSAPAYQILVKANKIQLAGDNGLREWQGYDIMFIGGWDFCEASCDGNLGNKFVQKIGAALPFTTQSVMKSQNTFHLENEV